MSAHGQCRGPPRPLRSLGEVPDLSGRQLLREWQQRMESVVTAAATLGGRAELPRQLVEPMQRQVEILEQIVERERALQRQLAGRLVAPLDVAFDLLEDSGATMRRQAEALEAAGKALEETAGLMKSQAALFERTIGVLRQPTDLARTAVGLEPRRVRAKRKPAPRGRKR
jgi:hypothetical protein